VFVRPTFSGCEVAGAGESGRGFPELRMRLLTRLVMLAVCLSYCVVWGSAQEVPAGDRNYQGFKDQQWKAFNPKYNLLRWERAKRAVALGKRVFELESAGHDTACAHQILTEVNWLLGKTAEFARTDERLDELENLLANPDLERLAEQQDLRDGSWGGCYTEWFFKLDATYDRLSDNSTPFLVAPRFLDRVNSPDKLRDYFLSVSTSDIAHRGRDNVRELNEALADLMRMILTGRPSNYRWDPNLRAALMDLILNRLRNSETGWWGERYLENGNVRFVDDLSMTFHVVRYLDRKVPEIGKLIDTALALRNQDSPPGWLSNGNYTDHNNMDVAVLFEYGWNTASDSQHEEMRKELRKMQDWCLKQSLQADGSFRITQDSDSIEESTYFGVAFLARIGFFDKNRCFWTEQNFLQSNDIRQRIIAYILKHRGSGATGGTYYESALRELDFSPPLRDRVK